jgi:ring-1,2-phenylacetyl-CoA epoxidase subunit PaaC
VAAGAKGVKEVTYHRDYAARWTVRLGDGTELSHERMQQAVDAVTPLLAELFRPHRIESSLATADVAVDPSTLRAEFDAVWGHVLEAATLQPAKQAALVDASTIAEQAGTAGPGAAGAGGSGVANATWLGAVPAETGVTGLGDVSGRAAGGRDGVHSPALEPILREMQGLARSLPGGVW